LMPQTMTVAWPQGPPKRPVGRRPAVDRTRPTEAGEIPDKQPHFTRPDGSGNGCQSTKWKKRRQRTEANQSAIPPTDQPPRAGSRDHQMMRALPLMLLKGTVPQPRESFELSRLSPMTKI